MRYEYADLFQAALPSLPATPIGEPMDPETFRLAVLEVIINKAQYNG